MFNYIFFTASVIHCPLAFLLVARAEYRPDAEAIAAQPEPAAGLLLEERSTPTLGRTIQLQKAEMQSKVTNSKEHWPHCLAFMFPSIFFFFFFFMNDVALTQPDFSTSKHNSEVGVRPHKFGSVQ